MYLKCIKGEKDVLTFLANPGISELKKKYWKIRRLQFSDEAATESKLPVHIILGAADYQRIKIAEPALLGPDTNKDLGADLPCLGGHFLENARYVPTNKALASVRLASTTQRLQKLGKLEEYDRIMREQLDNGIIERVPDKPTGEILQPRNPSLNNLTSIEGLWDIWRRIKENAVSDKRSFGIAAPVTIVGKIIYSEVCLLKMSWDEELLKDMQDPWNQWRKKLVQLPTISIPRSVTKGKPLKLIVHRFSDASKFVVAAAMYLVSHYEANFMHGMTLQPFYTGCKIKEDGYNTRETDPEPSKRRNSFSGMKDGGLQFTHVF
eukprot:gene8414-9314_t